MILSQLSGFGGLCREQTRSMKFQGGVPPVETILGVILQLQRRTGHLPIFVMWQVSVQVNVQNAGRSKRLPRFQIKAYSAIVRLVAEWTCAIPPSKSGKSVELRSILLANVFSSKSTNF
jgi:hypothetical protein